MTGSEGLEARRAAMDWTWEMLRYAYSWNDEAARKATPWALFSAPGRKKTVRPSGGHLSSPSRTMFGVGALTRARHDAQAT